jgi:DNA-binding response OmpR family regulator
MPPPVCSVLVADDDRPLCDLLDALLSEAGYHVRCAYDGEAAWVAVRQAPPDLILSDIKMPKLDGIQLAVRLAESADGIPVILMSAGYDDRAGVARAFLRKPFDIEAVLGLVAAVLNEQAAQGTEGGRT